MARKTFIQICADEVDELREIATYFDQRGNKINGDFLRGVARRFEYLFRVYHAEHPGKQPCEVCAGTGRVLDGEICKFCRS